MNDNTKVKTQYKLKNWREYNQALKARGSVTVWLSEEAREGWYQGRKGARGRPCVYSDEAISCALTLGAVFKQPLRGTQGFVARVYPINTKKISGLCGCNITYTVPVSLKYLYCTV